MRRMDGDDRRERRRRAHRRRQRVLLEIGAGDPARRRDKDVRRAAQASGDEQAHRQGGVPDRDRVVARRALAADRAGAARHRRGGARGDRDDRQAGAAFTASRRVVRRRGSVRPAG